MDKYGPTFKESALAFREASRCGNDDEETEARKALVNAVQFYCAGLGEVNLVMSYENLDDGALNDGIIVEFHSGVCLYIPC